MYTTSHFLKDLFTAYAYSNHYLKQYGKDFSSEKYEDNSILAGIDVESIKK